MADFAGILEFFKESGLSLSELKTGTLSLMSIFNWAVGKKDELIKKARECKSLDDVRNLLNDYQSECNGLKTLLKNDDDLKLLWSKKDLLKELLGKVKD